jgi:integrase
MRNEKTGKRKVKFVSLPNSQAGNYVEPGKTTLTQFLERWLAYIKTQTATSTHERYSELVHNNIVPALGAVRLTRLQPEHISGAYSSLLSDGRRDGRNGGLAPQTIRHMHTVLKQALKQACVWRAISHNPADLVNAARGTPIFIPVLLGILCGLRRGEICALRWRSVDLDAGGCLSFLA